MTKTLEAPMQWEAVPLAKLNGVPFIPVRTAAGEDVCAVFGRYSYFSDTFLIGEEEHARADLLAAAPALLAAQTMGNEVNTPDFLEQIADRLVWRGDSEDSDLVQSLLNRAAAGRAAIEKARGGRS